VIVIASHVKHRIETQIHSIERCATSGPVTTSAGDHAEMEVSLQL
jgi:hypothetical protein